MAELEVPALTASLGGDQYLIGFPEPADRLLLLIQPHAPVEHRNRVPHRRGKALLGLDELGEDDDLLLRTTGEDPVQRSQELPGLGVAYVAAPFDHVCQLLDLQEQPAGIDR